MTYTMKNDYFVFFVFFTRRDWLCLLFRFRFYHLTYLKFSAELFFFVIFSTSSFVLVQLFFIYRLSFRSLRIHYFTLLLFNTTQKKRLMIDVMSLRQSYKRWKIIEVKWIHEINNFADFMIKSKTFSILKTLIDNNTINMNINEWIKRLADNINH
jgi:hypothetical protein